MQEGFNPPPLKCAYMRGGEVMDEVKVTHVRVELGSGDFVHVHIHSALRECFVSHQIIHLSSLPPAHTNTLCSKSHISIKVPQRSALKCSTFVISIESCCHSVTR